MYKINLSPYANIFYTEWLLNPDSFRYNVSYVQMLHGKLDVCGLRKALTRYVNDHLLLNSHIQEINGKPHWVKNTNIRELEYFNYPVNDAVLLEYVTNKFDLYKEPLYRFRLIRVNEDSYKFVMVFNHIILDGSSFDDGIIDTISNYYNNGNYVTKYSIEEQINLNINLTSALSIELEKNNSRNEKFWRQQLSGIESIDLGFLKLNRKNNTEHCIELYNPIAEIKFSYENDEVIKLNQIKIQHLVTPYIYGQCILALLLYRYTGQEQLAIAYPIAIKEGVDFIYGAQLNINLAPYKFSRNMTIKELFEQSREFFNKIKQKDTNHSYYPITEFFNADNKVIDDRELLDLAFIQAPFRDKLFAFDGIDKAESLSELNVDSVPKEMFLFEQEIKLRNGNLNYRVRYDKRTLDNALVSNFVCTYQRLFLEILEDLLAGKINKTIFSYNLLDAKQYYKIIHEFNQTEKAYPEDKTIHQLFEEQALKTPDNIAVVYEDQKLTYQELNNKANQLANYLLKHHAIKPDDLIALLLDRSEYMIIGILAVLKTGAAYVPISPDYPDERIKYILDDTKAKIALNDGCFKKSFFLT